MVVGNIRVRKLGAIPTIHACQNTRKTGGRGLRLALQTDRSQLIARVCYVGLWSLYILITAA